MDIHKSFENFSNDSISPNRLVWEEGGEKPPAPLFGRSKALEKHRARVAVGSESDYVAPKYVPPTPEEKEREKEKEKEKEKRKEIPDDPINPGRYVEGDDTGNEDKRPILEKFPNFPRDLLKTLDAIRTKKIKKTKIDASAARQASQLSGSLRDSVIYQGIIDNWTPDSVANVYGKMLDRLIIFLEHPDRDQLITRRINDPLDPAWYESEVTHILAIDQATQLPLPNPQQNPHLTPNGQALLQQEADFLDTKMPSMEKEKYEKVFTGFFNTPTTGPDGQKMNYLDHYYIPFARRWFFQRAVVEGLDGEEMLEQYGDMLDDAFEDAQVWLADPDYWLHMPYRF